MVVAPNTVVIVRLSFYTMIAVLDAVVIVRSSLYRVVDWVDPSNLYTAAVLLSAHYRNTVCLFRLDIVSSKFHLSHLENRQL